MGKAKNKDLLYNMEKKYSETEFYLESERRDVYYSALIKDIVKNNRTGQVLKCIFFGIVCFAFIFICVFGIPIIYHVSKRNTVSYSDIAIAITGFGSVLSSVVVLPKIIARHLFPEDSEEVRFRFIKENQKLDQAYLEDDLGDVDLDNDENTDDSNPSEAGITDGQNYTETANL